MVKKICSFILSILCCCSLFIPAFAEASSTCEHVYHTAYKIDEAYCGHDGTKYFTCEICGETVTETITAPAKSHSVVTEKHFSCGSGEDGYIVTKCTICNRETDRQVIKAEDHKNHIIVEKEAKASTCSEKGNTFGKVCEFCGYVPEGSNYQELPLIPHTKDYMTFDSKLSTVTCTEDGVAVYKCNCEGCEVTLSEDTKALGHKLKVVNAKTATCTEEGNTGVHICTVCDETVEKAGDNTVIPKNPDNHDWKHDSYKVEASCGKKGIEIQKCSRCDEKKEVEVPAKEHKYEVTSPAKSATCTEDGVKATYTCENCGDKIGGEKIPASHTKPENIDYKAPTCSENGYEKYTCTVCGKKVDNVLPATGHDWDKENAVTKDATCTEKGSYTVTCKTCGKVEVSETPALGHEEITVPASKGDCTTPATSEHKACARCNKIYSEKNKKWYDKDEMHTFTVDGKELSKKAIYEYYSGTGNWKENPSHYNADLGKRDYEAPKKATCTEDGHNFCKCNKCGGYFSSDGVPRSEADALKGYTATGHKNTEIQKYEVFSTCEEPGTSAIIKCKDCGVILSDGGLTPKLSHIYEETRIEPSCKDGTNGSITETCHVKHKVYKLTTEGEKEFGVKYTVDGNAYDNKYYETDKDNNRVVVEIKCADSKVTIIDFKHNYISKVITEATCTKAGEVEWKCTECGDSYNEIIPAKGHTDELVDQVDATCAHTGFKAGVRCKDCGLWKNKGQYTEKDPREIIPINKDAHNITYIQRVAPTCTEHGLTGAYQCKECHKWLIEDENYENKFVDEDPRKVIFALGHNWKKDLSKSKDATLTETGLEVYYCNQCGETYEVVIPKLSENHTHSFYEYESKEATCTEDGYVKSKCAYCDATITKTICCTGHKLVIDEAVEATCTKTGLTQGAHCSECSAIVKAQETVSAKGHKLVTDNAIEATCTESGLTQGSHCAECGKVIKAQETVSAKGHNFVTLNKAVATYFANGYTGDTICSDCGKVVIKGSVIAKLTLAKPAITVTKGKRNITVKAKVNDATGYQITYKKKNGKWKTVTVNGNNLNKKIKKLTSGKKYTVKVRAFVKSGTQTVYSAYSKAKTVKVK